MGSSGETIQTIDFRKLFEASPGLYLVLTPELTIVGASDAYLQATMTERETIVGKGLFEVFPDNPDEPDATGTRNLRASLARVLQNKMPDTMAIQKYDVRKPESEGGEFEERYWSPVNSPVLNEQGDVIFIIHRVEDVTEFVRLKVIDTEQHKLTEELKLQTAQMELELYLRAQELQKVNHKLRAANEELDERKMELEIRVKEATDDLSRANAILKESEQQYRLLFESNPHPMWVFDSETLHFLAVNKAALLHYGFSREEFHAMTLKDIRPPDEADRLLADVVQQRSGIHTAGLWKHRKKDGSIIEVEITSHDIEYASRKAKVVLVHDVTDRKKLEAQVLRNQRMESIGTLAGGIAHDLNNVLAPILMAIQVLRRKYSDESVERILDTLEQSAQRGAGMVKQVLAFARGAEGERSILQVKHLIGEIEKIAKETFDRSIRVYTNVQKNLWTISGDATQLYQVLMNFCVNARDAMAKGGSLTIEASNIVVDAQYARMHLEAKPGPYVMISVTDTGTGIPPSIIEKIFEPFFTTKEIGQGTGLGLSTALGIVKGHGGFINVYSEPGKGTQFKIYFPAHKANEETPPLPAELTLPSGNGELILVVDDEVGVREITKTTLEYHGYKVQEASDGTEALAIYAQRRKEVHAIVTDMMMPYMDGPTTIRALLKMDPDVKIIAMSGLMENQKMLDLTESKYLRFLQKPFTSETFLTTLAELMD